MSQSTTVNPMITDAVTQANTKVVGEAPAMAMATIYQTIAHATSLALENAVSAQSQQFVISQAATAEAVTMMFSLNAATCAPLANEAFAAGSAKVQAASFGGINSQITDAVNQTLQAVLGSAGDFSYAVRSASEAMQATLNEISAANYQSALHTLQLAATATCLRLMLADPTQAEVYGEVLNSIRRLGQTQV